MTGTASAKVEGVGTLHCSSRWKQLRFGTGENSFVGKAPAATVVQ